MHCAPSADVPTGSPAGPQVAEPRPAAQANVADVVAHWALSPGERLCQYWQPACWLARCACPAPAVRAAPAEEPGRSRAVRHHPPSMPPRRPVRPAGAPVPGEACRSTPVPRSHPAAVAASRRPACAAPRASAPAPAPPYGAGRQRARCSTAKASAGAAGLRAHAGWTGALRVASELAAVRVATGRFAPSEHSAAARRLAPVQASRTRDRACG